MDMRFTINGEQRRCRIAPDDVLLDVLRLKFRLTGAKPACRRGECGACTVLLGGQPVLSCVTLAACVDEPVETVEGLVEEARVFREALADCGGFQCGYCTSGIVVHAVALLRQGLPPTDSDLRHHLDGNLCRCTGYQGIIEALRIAADTRVVVQ